MPATTFTWSPTTNSQHTCKPNVVATKFGDGYEVRVASGINSAPMHWSLTFQMSMSEALSVLNFLRARNATEAFNWTNPLNEVGVYVCREWVSVRDRGVTTISCTFEQVFEA